MRIVQPQFDYRIAAGRELVHIETVMDVCDRTEDDVLNLIATGALRWAFNIGSDTARRREIRIWRSSVEDYRQATKLTHGLKLADVIGRILPRLTQPLVLATIRGKELEHRLSCSQKLIGSLIKDGSLQLAFPTARKISPLVLHASAAAFLTRRELKGDL